jgi:SOS-response transcriptional repressor LexA
MAQRSTETPAPAKPLTEKQQAIFDFIRRTTYLDQRPPTVREIGDHFGIRSPNGVLAHLQALVKKGRLGSTPYASRCATPRGARPIDVLRAVDAVLRKDGRDPVSKALSADMVAALREIVKLCE